MNLPIRSLGCLVSAMGVGLCLRGDPGQLDPDFNHPEGSGATGPDGPVQAVLITSDDSIVIAGNFTKVGGQVSPVIARLTADGKPDPTFHSPFPTQGHQAVALAAAPGGRILVAGIFFGPNFEAFTKVTRLLSDGSVDPGFQVNGGLPSHPLSIAADVIGRVYLGCSADDASALIRLLPDGQQDLSFSSGYAKGVHAILPLSEWEVLVGGADGLARLNVFGIRDVLFNGIAGVPVYSMGQLDDGRLIVSGVFGKVGTTDRPGIASLIPTFFLLPDSASTYLDPGFNPTVNAQNPIDHILVLPDRSVVVAGGVTMTGATVSPHLVRYRSDGSQDNSFAEGGGSPDAPIFALGRQSTGAIIVGGAFTQWNSARRPYLARLMPVSPNPGFISLEYPGPVYEGTPAFRLTLRRDGGTQGVVSVQLSDLTPVSGDLHATNGLHYVFTPRRVQFADGQDIAFVDIPVIDDTLLGTYRDFSLGISDPRGGATVAEPITMNVRIFDNDFGVSLESADQVASEVAGTIDIRLVRQGAQGIPFSVEIETIPDTAREGIDYEPVRKRVDFAPDATSASARVRLLDDPFVDGSRTFRVRLRDPSGTNRLLAPSEGKVTIHDNERPGGIARTIRGSLVQGDFGISHLAGFHPLPDGSAVVILPGYRLGKILPDGTPDPSFNPAVINLAGASNNLVVALSVWDDGRILALGRTRFGSSSPLSRLLADGSRDPAFPTNITVGNQNGAFFPQPDGSFYVASTAITAGNVSKTGLARFHADGSIDTEFSPKVGPGTVNVLVVDTHGRIYIGGALSESPLDPWKEVTRLLPDGSPDPTYRATSQHFVGRSINAFLLAPDGSLYVGGIFSKFGESIRSGLIRLTPDGDLDAGFAAEIRGFEGKPNQGIRLLALQSDGRLLAVGQLNDWLGPIPFGPAELIRLMPDGSLDPTFDTGVIQTGFGFIGIGAMRVLRTGELLIQGALNSIDGVRWLEVVRLYLATPDAPSVPQFGRALIDTNRVVHLRLWTGGTGRFVVESSDDLGVWRPVSMFDSAPGVLEFTDTPPTGTTARFYRARSAP